MARKMNIIAESGGKNLRVREEKFCRLFCLEGSGAYLDRVEAFKGAGYSAKGTTDKVYRWASVVYNKPHIQERIKQLLPQVAFDQLFVRTEMKDLYDEVKKEGKTREQKDLLVEMAKVLGMYDKKSVAEDKTDEKEHVTEAIKQAQDLWNKRKTAISEKVS